MRDLPGSSSAKALPEEASVDAAKAAAPELDAEAVASAAAVLDVRMASGQERPSPRSAQPVRERLAAAVPREAKPPAVHSNA
jgi:hypothetical protein